MAKPDLVTLTDFLNTTGQTEASLDPNTGVPQIQNAIKAASAAVRSYCDRDFTLAADADQSPRQFRYEGAGFLEINDATAIHTVTVTASPFTTARVLDPSEWFASAVENPDGVLDQLEFYTVFPAHSSNPAMGFTYNADTIPWRGSYPLLIEVAADWGWPEYPELVRAATIITANYNVVQSDPSALSSEAIAGYSRSFNIPRTTSRGYTAFVQQIPLQAIALLDSYLRVVV